MALSLWVSKLPAPCHTLALNPETATEVESGGLHKVTLNTSQTCQLSHLVIMLLLTADLSFTLLPQMLPHWVCSFSPPSSFESSEIGEPITSPGFKQWDWLWFSGFHEPFSDLVVILCSALLTAALFLLPHITVIVWSPDKPFIFQFLCFIITMDVEQKG